MLSQLAANQFVKTKLTSFGGYLYINVYYSNKKIELKIINQN